MKEAKTIEDRVSEFESQTIHAHGKGLGQEYMNDWLRTTLQEVQQGERESLREKLRRMIVTKNNAEELTHTPLCRENPEKGNNHFFCSITNEDYFRNQTINEILNSLTK